MERENLNIFNADLTVIDQNSNNIDEQRSESFIQQEVFSSKTVPSQRIS